MNPEPQRCPICGSIPKLYGDDAITPACPECRLSCLDVAITDDEAWGYWRDLVSRFPACMRIQVGDVVQLLDGKRVIVASVSSPDTDYGWFFEDDAENQYYAESVGVWPWGLREDVTPAPMPAGLKSRLAEAMNDAGEEAQP